MSISGVVTEYTKVTSPEPMAGWPPSMVKVMVRWNGVTAVLTTVSVSDS